LELGRPEHDHRAACVVAQRYSSATFSFRFYFLKEKLGTLFKNFIL
jgi:hypothetical protein